MRYGLSVLIEKSQNATQLYIIFFSQGGVATLITMPLDVMKTRVMNAKPGQYAVSISSYSDDMIT